MRDTHACSVVSRQPSKAAEPVVKKLTELFRSLPSSMRRTITFDNGTEFAYHHRLHKLSMRTFFCDAHAPWQKGGIENAIGRMRRGLPRKTDLATLSDHRLLSVVRSYNHTPRKCLNFKTPAEVFTRDLLQDSTLAKSLLDVPIGGNRRRGAIAGEVIAWRAES